MNDKDFYRKLSVFGLPLFAVEETGDANSVLAQMVKSNDLRLWEGFAVVLANANQKGLFDYSAVGNSLKGSADKRNLRLLLLLSFALYQVSGLKFSWVPELKGLVKGEKEFKLFMHLLEKGKEFNLGGRNMSPERLKTVFTGYFQGQEEQLQNLSRSKDEFGLEYALSKLFSPKQKELFLKKFRGEVFTKTEKEYYSRSVKKKVLALANRDLYKMAQQLAK
jgi:hypothetical protein